MPSKQSKVPTSPIKEYFSIEQRIQSLDWRSHFKVSELNTSYVPQGLIHDNHLVYHTIHKRNKKSILIIFDRTNEEYVVVKELVMPGEATHTSDLSIFNGELYAVDYHSNYIYKYKLSDLQSGLKAHLVLIKKVKAYFNNLMFGSLEIIEHSGVTYLLLTSFATENRLFVLDFNTFFDQQLGFEESLIFSVEASYFTQGLYYKQETEQLYHSVNRFGVDFIFELSVPLLLQKKNYRSAITRSFLAPNKMIEDLSVEDNRIITSDEHTYEIYSADFDSAQEVIDYPFNDVSKVPYAEKLLSHRARVLDFQENTLDAYIEVLGTNITHIEIDIRFSSDSVPFAYHDARFTDGKKEFRFSNRTWKEIQKYHYDHKDLMITRLDEILAYFKEHRKAHQILAIDIKDFGFEEQLYNMFELYGVREHVIVFTWTPQTILALDMVFEKKGNSFPIYFSHVRTDSMFKYFLIPWFLNYRNFFLHFRSFVLIGSKNYKTPLGKFALGYHHVPYFTKIPEELIQILLKYKGGVCLTKKAQNWNDNHIKKLKERGLRVAVFGAIFGIFRINTKAKFEYEAQKEHVDLVFMDDLSKMIE